LAFRGPLGSKLSRPKSTLLKLLLGEIEPQNGSIKVGTGLKIGYFDQLRRDLDLKKTVVDTVGDGKDFVTIGGKDRHVMSYLQGFLFSAKRARSPVSSLAKGVVRYLPRCLQGRRTF